MQTLRDGSFPFELRRALFAKGVPGLRAVFRSKEQREQIRFKLHAVCELWRRPIAHRLLRELQRNRCMCADAHRELSCLLKEFMPRGKPRNEANAQGRVSV